MPSERPDHVHRAGRTGRAGWRRIRAVSPLTLAPVLAGLLLLLLVLPAHRTGRPGQAWLGLADSVTLVSLGLLAVPAAAGLALAVHAVAVARDPGPRAPESGTRVAFLTTYAPGGEPLSSVRVNLEGAVRMRHPGPLDVWLLDEGDDPEARMLCAELGVHHFTRLGVPEWNRAEGPHRAGARHGNLNAWVAKHGDAYDLVASVETGHVPLPGFLERMTGYFRDPDTAFVVGPRPGGDDEVHALAQRAGNRYGAAALAGPGSVVRIAALRRAGGFHDSAGEDDTATGLEIHRRRDPRTGRYWRSVRVPHVTVSHEGYAAPAVPPRGALLRQYAKALFRMPPGRLLGYTLLLVHRPVAVLTWLLGVLSCVAALTHPAARGWAALALVIALAPLAARSSLTPLRTRGNGGGPGALGTGRSLLPAMEGRRTRVWYRKARQG
ncbi:glycosyl transferase [Streptomyces sp. NPDC002793]|uniref:glycosyl transferase n=1 Tax=Streptomyces sp. NPDC002793 TaxID=3154432 RepID=UPI0033335C6B